MAEGAGDPVAQANWFAGEAAFRKELAQLRLSERSHVSRWWSYAVLRGEGIPARLDGVWFDVRAESVAGLDLYLKPGVTFEATNQWEQREDGAVAVVYRRMP